MNLPLESRHNQFAAVRVIDQAIGYLLGFLGARNTMVQLVFCCKYVCVEFYANFKIILQYSHHNVLFARNDPAHVSYTKVNIFVFVVFSITMLKVSEFSPQVAYLFDAPF